MHRPSLLPDEIEALVESRMKPLEAAGEKPLRVSRAPAWQSKPRHPDVLYEGHYLTSEDSGVPANQTGRCHRRSRRREGVARLPRRTMQGSVLPHPPGSEPKERAARAKELPAERVEKLTCVRILNTIRRKLPASLSRPDVEMAALDYFERLGHDNHRRLCRVYAREEKKAKASWGGQHRRLQGHRRKDCR